MFNRDTFRLIKRTYKRFLSLFLIVMIGVAFMVGVMASAPVLQRSVDDYDDRTNLMDVQIYSSYGFVKEDVTALKNTRGVEDVFASKFVDVYGKDEEGNSYVTRMQEMDSDINRFELASGRLPENPKEALALESSSFGAFYRIGEKVKISLDDKEELDEKLKYDEYTIVGTVYTPQYMSSTNEVSTLDNLELDTVLFVDNDDFLFEYYTTVFLTLENAKEEVAFGDNYQKLVDRSITGLERTRESQGDFLKGKIVKEAEKEIEKGEKELADKVEDASKEMEAAEKKLEDAYVSLVVAETQITSNELQIEAGQKEIDVNQKILDENAGKINAAIQEIEKTTGMSLDEAYSQIEATYYLYLTLKAQQEELPGSIEALKQKIEENKAEIKKLEEEKNTLQTALDEELAKEEALQDPDKIAELEKSIADCEKKIEELNAVNQGLEEALKQLEGNSIQDVLDKMDEAAGGSVVASYTNLKKLVEGKKEIDSGYTALNAAKKELEAGKKQLEEAKKEVASGRYQYNSGLKELEDARYTLEQEVEKAENELAKARQDLSELPDAEWTILDRSMHYSSYMFENTISQMRSIGLIFPLLFFLVAALVCMTTMTRLIDEERSQLGIFSALGFSKEKIISKYLMYALLASISGSLVGLVVGVFLFPVVIYEAWRLMYNLPEMKLFLPVDIALLGVFAFAVLIAVVTYFVAKLSLKEVPAQLMRPKAPKNAKKVFLEKIPFIWKNLSFTSKITARNIIRYKSRFFMTVIGVAGCTGLLVAGYGIKDSISDIINIQFSEIFHYTHTVSLEDDHHLREAMDALNSNSNNEQVVAFQSYASKVYLGEEEKTITVEVFDDRQIDRVIDLRTRQNQEELDIHGDGVIVSEKFAKVNHLAVGDEIVIESANGIKGTFVIDGICELYFQHYLFLSDELYEETFHEKVRNDQIAVKAIDGDEMMKDLEGIEGIVSVVDFTPMIQNFQNMIDALDIIILVIIVSAGSLAFVVLMNLTEVNISERLREIATLKVLGFNDREVNGYIFKEIFLLTIIGALVGLPLGKVEHRLIMTVIDMDMVMFGTNINLISYVYAFLITMIFTVLVLLSMSKTLRRIEMVESLKSVE